MVDSGASCAGGGAVLLNTLTASGSATLSDTTSLTGTYTWYTLVFENIKPANGTGTPCEIQVHSGGGFITTSTYQTVAIANGTATTGVIAYIPCSGNSGAGVEPDSSSAISGTIRVYVPTTASVNWEGQVTYQNAGASLWEIVQVGGFNPSITIDGFQVKFGTGNISSGSIRIYGNP